jgi:hypothetical protein
MQKTWENNNTYQTIKEAKVNMLNNEPIWFNGNENTKEIKIEDAKKPVKIFVATPCHSDVSMHFCQSVLVFQMECMKRNIMVSFSLLKSSLVQQGRNLLTSEFINDKENYDYLLFIDSDIDFQSDTIFRMIEKDKDLIACPYPMKTFDWDRSWRRLHNEAIDQADHLSKSGFTFPIKVHDKNEITVKDGVAEVSHVPTGCLLIKRTVIEQMMKQYPELIINQPTIVNGKETYKQNFFNLFDCLHDPETKEFFGEDFGFCRRWTKMGGKVHAYIMDYITHVGEYQYCGRLWDELQYTKRIDENAKK